MKSLLYPCLPWYDASDEWLFACSGDAKQSEVFPIIPFPIIPLETNSKNQLARSKKSPVWTMTGKVTIWGFLSEKKKQGYNRIKALSLCQGCTRSLGRAPGRPSPWPAAQFAALFAAYVADPLVVDLQKQHSRCRKTGKRWCLSLSEF